uniref:Uncharacterized protein n=1 Tax=Oryza sativa subsp. japonica TaxID=39947 RepID=Q8LN92_ORYSJ|nr:hypothetical protein [Oryza sativa Japonica Group]
MALPLLLHHRSPLSHQRDAWRGRERESWSTGDGQMGEGKGGRLLPCSPSAALPATRRPLPRSLAASLPHPCSPSSLRSPPERREEKEKKRKENKNVQLIYLSPAANDSDGGHINLFSARGGSGGVADFAALASADGGRGTAREWEPPANPKLIL